MHETGDYNQLSNIMERLNKQDTVASNKQGKLN